MGDIGPKFGYDTKENGFIRFSHLRIPRENMLGKYVEITSSGEIFQKGNPKMIYSSMLKVRKFLLSRSAFSLGKGVAIAVRYSHLRRQFKNEKKEEIPVIEYQLQKYKLYPLLAKSYAMMASYFKIEKLVEKSDFEVKSNDFKSLQEIHVMLSGAKAFYTWGCLSGLKVCLESCGGHGYSQYSGIPNIIEMTAPNTILEGENTVMALQVGKFLVKCVKQIQEGKSEKVNGYCQYLKNEEELIKFNAGFKVDMLDLNNNHK